jgi:peptidoglycan-associated lipoprotein
MLRNRSVMGLVLVTVTLAACSRKQAPQGPAAVPTSDTGVTTTAPTTPPPPPSTSGNDNSNSAAAAAARAALTAMVFFDYDQSTIRDDSKTVLDQKIVLLRNNPGVALRIEGHADERGSVEYNLALSLRRANAIKDYLTNFGLDGSRFEVAAMGEERPLESGTSEAAYARNRRGEFYITRGGDNLVTGR